jgi:hypothetical protein
MRERRLYGCLKPHGRVWFIWDGSNWADPVGELRQLRLAGIYFAGALPWVEGVFGGELIGRTNLATGVSRTTAPIATEPMDYPFVATLILARGGGVAWGARSSAGSTIRCWGRRGPVRVLDSDPAADGRSLHLAAGRLTWMRGTTRQSARMC